MYSPLLKQDPVNSALIGRSGACVLADDEVEAVLQFLPKKPAHCAYLADLIQENGLISPLNRGTFYASKNFLGELRGVALIGHATVVEATNYASVKELAETAANCKSTHLVMTEQRWAEDFWRFYGTSERAVELERTELLLELRWPTDHSSKTRRQVRLATSKELELLGPVHALLARSESGVDPRELDNDGFLARYQQRIRNGRTWVLTQNDQLIFKAEVLTATRETCYVEGVWVNPAVRGLGYGRDCIAELARMLLCSSRTISLLVNEDDIQAQSFYKSCGFRVRGSYRTAFLRERVIK